MVLSICIPTINRLDYLIETIDSCQSNESGIELIVSANGSAPEAITWLESNSQNKHFSYLVHPVCLPPFTHWNKLLEKATGDFVVILSDDDLMTEPLFDSILRDAKEHPESVMLMYGHDTIDQFGNLLAHFRAKQKGLLLAEHSFHSLMDGVEHRLCAIAFNRKSLQRIGGFPEQFKITAGDSEVIQKLSMLGPVYFSENPLAIGKYRIWEGSDTSRKYLEEQWHKEINIWTNSVQNFCDIHGYKKKRGWPASIRVSNYWYACKCGIQNGKSAEVRNFSKTIPSLRNLSIKDTLKVACLRHYWVLAIFCRCENFAKLAKSRFLDLFDPVLSNKRSSPALFNSAL